MTIIRRFNYSDNEKITAIRADQTNYFVWLAFEQNTDGICIIEKQSPFQPNQTFFSIEREVDQVVGMDLDSDNLYVAYNDDINFIESFSLSNPLTVFTSIEFPSGIIESPVDIKVNGSDIWILLPGNISGENAKLLKFNTSLVLQETIDLTKSGSTVYNANSFTIDNNDELWVTSFTDPAKYTRVYPLSGGGYDFTIFEL